MIAVLGGTGFVGSHFVPRLARHERLRLLVRSERGARWAQSLGVEWVLGDVRTADSVSRCVCGADTVVDLVAVTHERALGEFREVYLEGTRNLLRAAAAQGASRIVRVGALATESDARDPARPYLYWRRQADDLLCSSFPSAAVVKTSILFGPGDQLVSATAAFIKLLPVIPIAGSEARQTRFQPLHVLDLLDVVGALLSGARDLTGRIELGGPEVLSYGEILERIARSLARSPHVVMAPRWAVRAVLAVCAHIWRWWPIPPEFLDLAGVDSVVENPLAYDGIGRPTRRFTYSLDYLDGAPVSGLLGWGRQRSSAGAVTAYTS